MLDRGIYCTYIEGQALQSNGRAEAGVKFAQGQTKKLREATGMSLSLWPVAIRFATWCQKERVLGRGRNQVPFGARLHVRSKVYGTGGRCDSNVRWKEGKYVGASLDVKGRHVIRTEDNTFITTMHMRPGLVEADDLLNKELHEAVVAVPVHRVRGSERWNPWR